jgi:hypothetical protein
MREFHNPTILDDVRAARFAAPATPSRRRCRSSRTTWARTNIFAYSALLAANPAARSSAAFCSEGKALSGRGAHRDICADRLVADAAAAATKHSLALALPFAAGVFNPAFIDGADTGSCRAREPAGGHRPVRHVGFGPGVQRRTVAPGAHGVHWLRLGARRSACSPSPRGPRRICVRINKSRV